MALWQFDLYLFYEAENLPDTSVNGWTPPALTGSALLDARRMLLNYFGQPWSLAAHWFIFGPEEGSRVDVIFEDETTAAVIIRLDMRDESPQLCGLACRMAHELGCMLFAPDLSAIIQPHQHALRFAIADAAAIHCEKI